MKKRRIKLVNVTGYTPEQIETAYNNNYGQKYWRIVQVVVIANKTYVLAEKEE